MTDLQDFDDSQKLEELREKAAFLKQEKKRLIETRQRKEEIEKLQQEIHELETGDSKSSTIYSDSSKRTEVELQQWRVDPLSEKILLDAKWEEEKARKNAMKIAKDKENEQAATGCLGILALFFPILWPIFLIQIFRAYPGPAFATLAILVAFVIIIAASLH